MTQATTGLTTTTADAALSHQHEIAQGFAVVRERHQYLQAVLHQVMRKVALPVAREIGQELTRIKGFYARGQKGPNGHASRFYPDCELATGLKKAQVANYILISENWDRLLDHMADLPEGAAPITSMRGALEAIRGIRKQEALGAGKEEAIDVDAETLSSAPSGPSTDRIRKVRRTVVSALQRLLDTPAGLNGRTQLKALIESVEATLDILEESELEAVAPGGPVFGPGGWLANTNGQQEPEQDWGDPQQAAPAPGPEPEEQGSVAKLYPATTEGLAALNQAIAEHGSGAALGRHLRLKNPSYVSVHRGRILARLAAQEQD